MWNRLTRHRTEQSKAKQVLAAPFLCIGAAGRIKLHKLFLNSSLREEDTMKQWNKNGDKNEKV